MSDVKELAVRAAVLKTLADWIVDTRDQVNAELLEALDAGDRKRAVHDGQNLATVSKSDPVGKFVVTDTDAFLEWVRVNAPTEVETVTTTRVRPAYVSALVGKVIHQVDVDDGVIAVDPDTGEVVPGMSHKVGAPYVSVRQSAEQRQATVAAVLAHGSAYTSLLDVLEPPKTDGEAS